MQLRRHLDVVLFEPPRELLEVDHAVSILVKLIENVLYFLLLERGVDFEHQVRERLDLELGVLGQLLRLEYILQVHPLLINVLAQLVDDEIGLALHVVLLHHIILKAVLHQRVLENVQPRNALLLTDFQALANEVL